VQNWTRPRITLASPARHLSARHGGGKRRSDNLVNIAAISAGGFQSQIRRVRQDNPKGPPVSNPWFERRHHECLCHRVTTPVPAPGSSPGRPARYLVGAAGRWEAAWSSEPCDHGRRANEDHGRDRRHSWSIGAGVSAFTPQYGAVPTLAGAWRRTCGAALPPTHWSREPACGICCFRPNFCSLRPLWHRAHHDRARAAKEWQDIHNRALPASHAPALMPVAAVALLGIPGSQLPFGAHPVVRALWVRPRASQLSQFAA
jgi:hypothetical protein